MTRLYVIGGQQRAPRPTFADDDNWYEYRQGIILEVDVDGDQVQTCLEYVSPDHVRGNGDPVLFKAGTVEGNRLYACTQTELLVFELPGFRRLAHISLPCFNDVHHVRPTPAGNLLVANSGLEMVLELTPAGDVVREWNVLGEPPWANFSRDVDYRQSINLKPHRAHPNYVFYAAGEPWATRFECRDAVCLTDPRRRIEIGRERVHDGVLHDGHLYFTTVDGHLVIAEEQSAAVVETINLNEFHGDNVLAGWCRGLLCQGDHIWVGYSRIRPTRFRQALSWVRQGFAQSMPTHIACYDLNRRRLLREIELETHGLNAVFSIFNAAATVDRGSGPAAAVVDQKRLE